MSKAASLDPRLSLPPRGPGRPPGRAWMLREAKNLYLDRLETNKRKARTLKVASLRLDMVERFFGWEKDLRTWSNADRANYIKERSKTACNRTINFDLTTLQAMVKCSVKEGKLIPTPALLSIGEKLPVEEHPVQELKMSERAALKAAARAGAYPERTELIIAIVEDAGLRHREACQLAISDIDLEAREIIVTSGNTKSRKQRSIFISDVLCAQLKAYIDKLPKDQRWLFPGRYPERPMGHMFRWVREAYKAAGLYDQLSRPGLHAIRKSWATDHADSGTPVHHLQRMAGWENMSTAQKYIVSNKTEQREATERMHSHRQRHHRPLKPEVTVAAKGNINLAELDELIAAGMPEAAAWKYLKEKAR